MFLAEVLSYNLLAPAFVRPIDLRTGAIQPFAAFQWVSEDVDVLSWARCLVGRFGGSFGFCLVVIWVVWMLR